jgi:hypothetical protein
VNTAVNLWNLVNTAMSLRVCKNESRGLNGYPPLKKGCALWRNLAEYKGRVILCCVY